jgi:hypothetical protein
MIANNKYLRINNMKWILLVLMLIFAAYFANNSFLSAPDTKGGLTDKPILVQPVEQSASQKSVNIQDKWKADTAMYFYQSLSLYNYQHAAKYVTEPETILAMEGGNGRINVKENSYRVKEVRDNSVLMSFSRFCYPDLEKVVYLEHTPVGFRIDIRRSLKHQMTNIPANYFPNRQYCYDFKDQSLQGLVMGIPWQPVSVETNVVSFTSGPKKQIALVTERCEQFPECTFIGDNNNSGFILYVDALDFTGSGGNLGGNEYVRVFNYPDFNQSFYEGSYRITQLGGGRLRLELSIPEFESIELNGYIEFSL